MTTELTKDDLLLLRGVLSRERTACRVAAGEERASKRPDVAMAYEKRADRCDALVAFIATKGTNHITFHNPDAPAEEPTPR